MSLRTRPSRRLAALAVGALIAVPTLSSCGFNYATDRVNTISAGANDRDGEVDVLGAVIIAGEDDLGVFVATLVNNSLDEDDALSAMAQGTDDAGVGPIDEAISVAIPSGGRANLIEAGGIPVAGTFGAGDYVDVTLSFTNGQVTTLEVPVVTPCHQYSLDKLTTIELPVGTAAEEPAEAHAETETDEAHSNPGPYSCEAAEPVEHGEPAEGEEPVE